MVALESYDKSSTVMNVIGIDCATDPKKIGLSRARIDNEKLYLLDAKIGNKQFGIVDQIGDWISDQATLIAMDAPLGWPDALGAGLKPHQAGQSLNGDPNHLFRRETDRFVKLTTGKQPLDVGADRIARTAHAALALLDNIRKQTGKYIPLAWTPSITQTSVIEVYPAATLLAYGLPASSYKDSSKEHQITRSEIIDGLEADMDLGDCRPALQSNADILDSALCCFAGYDFLMGNCIPPENLPLAKKEGWIWIEDKVTQI